MFKNFRRALQAVVQIAQILEGLLEAVHGLSHGSATDPDVAKRLAAVEREFERRNAEAEGLLLRAKGQLDAARAAEERQRRLAERSPESSEPIEELAEAYAQGGVPQADGDDGSGQGVLALHGSLASRRDSKSNAYAMKWGG
jgi:hypothetical protein